MTSSDIFSLVTVSDALQMLSTWVRSERQRRRWTQGELARRSGVPSSTISRLERTGLGSTDAVLKILFALKQLDAMADFLKERQRLEPEDNLAEEVVGCDLASLALAAGVSMMPSRLIA